MESNPGHYGTRPPAGTMCREPCVKDSDRWGASYCYTDYIKSQWGAECVDCGMELVK